MQNICQLDQTLTVFLNAVETYSHLSRVLLNNKVNKQVVAVCALPERSDLAS